MITALVGKRIVRFAVLSAFCLGALGCASTPSVADFDLRTVAPDQLLNALADVDAIRSSFTRAERDKYYNCYDSRLANCLILGDMTVEWKPLLLGCAYDAYPEHDHQVNGYCPHLAAALVAVGNLQGAKTVLLHAPGCHAFNNAGDHKELCFQGAVFWGGMGKEVGGWRGVAVLTDDEMMALARSALEYDPGSVEAASYLARHGVNVSVAAAMNENKEQRGRNKEATQEKNEAAAQAIAARDAKSDAFLGALRGMAGAGDPNAIVNAGNQQAAALRAVGDAAASRQYGSSSLTSPAQTGSAILPSSAGHGAAAAGKNNFGTASNGMAAAPSGGGNASVTDDGSHGAGPGTGNSAGAARSTSCDDESSFVTAKAWEDTQVGWAVGSLTNNSDQVLYVHYTFALAGQPLRPAAAAATIRPGQTLRGEMAGVWASNADNPPKIFWWAVPQSQQDQGNCPGPW